MNEEILKSEIFRHDWQSGVEVESAYTTSVVGATSLSEQRWGLRSIPTRNISLRLNAFTKQDTLRLIRLANKITKTEQYLPLASDFSYLTSSASSGASTVSCDTTMSRFKVGGKAAIHNPSGKTAETEFEILTISSKNDSSITFSETLSRDYPKGSIVLPMMLCEIDLAPSGSIVSDANRTLTLPAREVVGSSQLPSTQTGGTVPSGFSSYQGLPILDPDPDYAQNMEWGFMRPGQYQDIGIGQITDTHGSRGRYVYRYRNLLSDRSFAWDVIRLFDSRMGRLRPLWLIERGMGLSIEAISTSEIDVSSALEEGDWDAIPALALTLADGSTEIREIDSVDGNAVTLASAASGTITAACVCYKVRFEQDALTENWITDQTCVMDFSFIEVINEKVVDDAVDELSTTPLSGDFSLGFCSCVYISVTRCSDGAQRWVDGKSITAFFADTENRYFKDTNGHCFHYDGEECADSPQPDHIVEIGQSKIAYPDCTCEGPCECGGCWFSKQSTIEYYHRKQECSVYDPDSDPASDDPASSCNFQRQAESFLEIVEGTLYFDSCDEQSITWIGGVSIEKHNPVDCNQTVASPVTDTSNFRVTYYCDTQTWETDLSGDGTAPETIYFINYDPYHNSRPPEVSNGCDGFTRQSYCRQAYPGENAYTSWLVNEGYAIVTDGGGP